METKKLLAIGIIFLFICVAVAPSINSSVVKASDDLVEVTSQTCGIQGFGNTTVKLTKQQYQNLEQYLVEFRARLNQTTTREEAIPIFKDAVVELNKHGLLPNGMSIEKTQKLVIGSRQNKDMINLIKKIYNGKLYQDNENYFCLIAGQTSNTKFQSFTGSCLDIIDKILLYFGLGIPYPLIVLFFIINILNPLSFIQRIGIGCYVPDVPGYENAKGWIYTMGLLGVQKWNGSISGNLNQNDVQGVLNDYSSAVDGFTGLKIINIVNNGYFYLGTALKIKISVS